MDDFFQMHVFFVVATIAVVVFVILVAVALFYVVRILRSIDRVAREVHAESALIREDISRVREKARAEGVRVSSLLDIVLPMVKRRTRGRKEKGDTPHTTSR